MIIFAIWNGLVINWKHGSTADIWHAVGFMLRGIWFIETIVINWGNWLLMSFYLSLLLSVGWGGYNIIINIIVGQKWYYLGKSSKIDLFFTKNRSLYWTLQVILLLTLIILGIWLIKN